MMRSFKSNGSPAVANVTSTKHGSTSHQRAGGMNGTVSSAFSVSSKSDLLMLNSILFDVANREGTGNASNDAGPYETTALPSSIGAAKRYFRVDMPTYVRLQIKMISYPLHQKVSFGVLDVTSTKYILILLVPM